MATDAQLNANRANAQLSTGPRTAEGKAASSQNNVQHGLASRRLIVAEEDRPEFELLAESLRLSMLPAGTIEEFIFDQLLTARWNMERVQKLEVKLFAETAGVDPLSLPETAKRAASYHSYYLRYEGSFNRSLKQLEKLQTNRAIIEDINEMPSETLPPLTDLPRYQQFVRRSQSLPPQPDSSPRLLDDQSEIGLAEQEINASGRLSAVMTLPKEQSFRS